MLLRLAYLGVTNAFAMLRLLPMSDRDKDVEILALRLWVPNTRAVALSCAFSVAEPAHVDHG